MQGKPIGSLDVEPDQELTAPGNTIFEELAGSDGDSAKMPDTVARSSAANKLSKGREGPANARNSELYIGGLEDMKVCCENINIKIAEIPIVDIWSLRRSNLNLK